MYKTRKVGRSRLDRVELKGRGVEEERKKGI